MLNLILIIGFYLLVSGATPFYCPVKLRFCVRSNSCIVVRFRPIFAIYDLNGEFLGFVEFISKFNSISKNLKFENIEPIFILSKEKSEKIIEPFSKIFIHDNYIVNIDADKTILKFIEQRKIDSFLNIANYIIITYEYFTKWLN